ncbi:MAG: two-component system, chemotaxis family, protein-glutamate methylesterase/glutaminase [Campylobacterota bacterium]|nr:two-component system, chemotaxis family, protein-glutamate methylesterase/glutaminase [Campylobacterota bacterium]
MATEFLPSFVKRLQESSSNPISIAENNDMLLSGHIYFCNGKTQVDVKNSSFYFISDASYTNGYNPNINSIFTSLSKYTGSFDLLGVILTGIGDDGVDGCKQLAINGAKTLTETSQSAIVDGMPFRARECVPNITVQKIDDIIRTIKEFCY